MATATPNDFLQVGYSNGQIPDCDLRSISQVDAAGNPIKLHPQAAEQMNKLLSAAQRAGIRFRISSGYRDFDTQVSTKEHRRSGAATPGQSKHGWGTAVDIGELFKLAEDTANALNVGRPENQKLTYLSPDVHAEIRRTSRLYQWLDENAPKYGWVNPTWARKPRQEGATINECWHWEYQSWPLPEYVQFKPTEPDITLRCGQDTPIRNRYALVPNSTTAPTQNITPFIGSLESFHPRIQYELTRRRIASETANTYMPFVRLTSLTNVLGNNIQGGTSGSIGNAWCPSLGPHGEKSIEFDNVYLPQDNRSIVGYAIEKIPDSGTEVPLYRRIPVIVEESAVNTDQKNIPMPGIIEMSAERGTAGPMGVRGGLIRADIKIAAYSVGQVDTLLRYFLRPATRVVLEWGRNSSNQSEPLKSYKWNQSADEIASEFTALISNPDAQTQFIDDYIYANNGNYEIFIGYVVKFDLKYNKNNVYEIGLTVHSVQQFEIPTRHTGVKSLCPDAVDKCAAMDINEYFSEEYSWKQRTFKKLMSNAETTRRTLAGTYEWHNHFVGLRAPTTTDVGTGTDETEYLVSWQFFVDKILNDQTEGIASLITDTKTRELIQTGLLKSTRIPDEVEKKLADNKLIANEVGYHPDLRSVNPNVMVIYNSSAQSRRTADQQRNFSNLIDAALTTREQRSLFYDNTQIEHFITGSSIGAFSNKASEEANRPAAGYLTNGVWIHTKAIKQAFLSNDTISSAINSLLSMMSAATEGYWNLQLYSSDRPNPGLFVIDWGLSKRLTAMNQPTTEQNKFPWIDNEEKETTNILNSVNSITPARYAKDSELKEPKYIYMFNRKTKRFADGELGSDILDLNVEFNLPQVVAVQAIAGVGGPAQKSTLQSLDIPQLNKISLINNLFASCDTQNICVNQECNDDDLRNLKAAWDTAQKPTGQEQVRQTQSQIFGFDGFAAAAAAAYQQSRTEQQAKTQYQTALVQRTYGNLMVIDAVRELSDFGTLLRLVEFNPAAMVKKLNIDSRTSETGQETPYAHAFNSSNLTKTIVNVTLPGIGGIELFQSFLVDRVPSILERGFYVVTKIVHKFSPSNGWTTSIEGRFRYRPSTDGKGTGYTNCITDITEEQKQLAATVLRGAHGERSSEQRTTDYISSQFGTSIVRPPRRR